MQLFGLGFGKKQTTDAVAASQSHGGPTYDATIEPAIAGEIGVQAARLQAQRDLHLWYDKSAPAQAFSHYYEGSPSRAAIQMMGLAAQRDQIASVADRKWEQPFPGVSLGHVPSFSPAPSTNPITPPIGPKSHHAHQIESKRKTRARFGR